MAKTRLIFCRTPLQSRIVERIQQVEPADDVIVYHPSGFSPKHDFYFGRLRTVDKLMLPARTPWPSQLFDDIRTGALLKARFRGRSFDEYCVSSFGSLPFAMLLGRSDGAISTFDDGVFNVLPQEIRAHLEPQNPLEKLVRNLTGSPMPATVCRRSRVHYTIFPPALAAGDFAEFKEIGLIASDEKLQPTQSVSVLLGTLPAGFAATTSSAALAEYGALMDSGRFDIVIPHPLERRSAFVAPHISERGQLLDMIEEQIAEDVVVELHRLGYRVQLFGFASTALVTVAPIASSANIVIAGLNDADSEVFTMLGIANIDAEQALERVAK